MKHFHYNMVAKQPLTACGILGLVGETNIKEVSCTKCTSWLKGKGPAVPKIVKKV